MVTLIITPKDCQDDTNRVKKEIVVHKLLKHKNIVQCYGSRLEGTLQMIFLEYCR